MGRRLGRLHHGFQTPYGITECLLRVNSGRMSAGG